MDYEWDPARELASRRSHGVAFADAVMALEDPLALTKLDANGHREVRFVSLGMDGCGRLLVTVFTHRGDRVRIISARSVTPGERRQYESAT